MDAAVAWERANERGHRSAHAVGAHVHELETWAEFFTSFEHVSIDAPSLSVDTTEDYAPGLAEIVAFVGG